MMPIRKADTRIVIQILVPDWVVVVAMIKTGNASDNQNLVRRRAVWPLADSASD
jgi:hypothetical protein